MPHLEPRLAVRAIRPLVSGLTALGYDPAPLLDEVGIDALMRLGLDEVRGREAQRPFWLLGRALTEPLDVERDRTPNAELT